MARTIRIQSSINLFLLFFIISLSNSTWCLSINDCNKDQECKDALVFSSLSYYSTRDVILSGFCFDPRRNSTPPVSGDSIQVENFKPKSSWLGAYLMDLHGAALSPLFLAHEHLSCTEFLLSRIDAKGRLSLEMKHYSNDKVDYRFDFNQSGWIEYNKRYGCHRESLQVDNTRIIDTDYEHYVVIYGCAESHYQSGFHISGYLLLVSSPEIPDAAWKKVQSFFYALFDYDAFNYTLPDRRTILTDRETFCQEYAKKESLLCPKKSVMEMLQAQPILIKDLVSMQKSREKKTEQWDPNSEDATAYIRRIKQEEQDVPVEEISCYVTMFISIALAIYWTHFSF